MEKSQEKLRRIVTGLPDTPGIYKFLDSKKKPIYIGKATSLKNRVKSYFGKDLNERRGAIIVNMVSEAMDIVFEKTDSVLEALILEAALIKRHLPKFNSIGKDQKSWNYVVITDEKFPRVLVVREREITPLTLMREPRAKFGPFTNGGQLKEALKIIRKIFPFRDKCFPSPSQGEGSGVRSKPCFNYQIGLCPGVCIEAISEKDYKKNIRHIIQFFQGKKTKIIGELEKDMRSIAREKKFEEAGEIKRKIFALKHIEDIALIKKDRPELQSLSPQLSAFRIEAYDVAHISGTNMVGVMTVIEGGEIKKQDYRMFKIKWQKKTDDTRALQEILIRRSRHAEWRFPDLIVVDGSIPQINFASKTLEENGLEIPVVAVTKDKRHRAKEIKSQNKKAQELAKKYEKEILLANSEAHRFAVSFHRRLRDRVK